MGLDINIATDKDDTLFDADYFESADYQKHQLSRTFCDFMNRRNVIDTVPELDQIGQITNIDITPLYEMDGYPHAEAIEFQLMTAESDGERESILKGAEESKERLKGNIDTVLSVVNNLIAKLKTLEQLPITTPDVDTLDFAEYFADFNSDKGDGYIGNNFGQDLRNLQTFLHFAKAKGVTTVYFVYG